MAITFKYKNHLSLSYAPGISIPGKDGLPGKKGISGNSMYFVDFDLDNSYSIDLALQKIENNKILTNDSDISINQRPYKANDILISNTGNVYKIVTAKNDKLKTKNYKFDIKFLGKIHKPIQNDAVKLVIYDITGLIIENCEGRVKAFPARQLSCVPTNRCEPIDPFGTNTINSGSDLDHFYMYGAWIKPVLWVNTDLTTEKTPLEKRLKYSFLMELNNTKELIGKRKPGSTDSIKFNFNKNLEFVNPGIAAIDSSVVSPEELIFTDEFLTGLSGYRHSQYKTIYLSDMFMDKFHPSNNNIQCTLDDKSNTWYKIGRNSFPVDLAEGNRSLLWTDFPYVTENGVPTSIPDVSTALEDYPRLGLGDDAFVTDETGTKTKCQKTIDDFTSAMSYYAVIGGDASKTITSEMFPRYSIGKSLTDINCELNGIKCTPRDVIEGIYDPDSGLGGLDGAPINFGPGTFLLTDKRSVPVDRFRAGDSAYFSSICIDSDYDDLTCGIRSNNVSNEIFDFISSDKNTYKLIIKKAKSKTISISSIAVEFDTVTFRNRYYKQYNQGEAYVNEGIINVSYRNSRERTAIKNFYNSKI